MYTHLNLIWNIVGFRTYNKLRSLRFLINKCTPKPFLLDFSWPEETGQDSELPAAVSTAHFLAEECEARTWWSSPPGASPLISFIDSRLDAGFSSWLPCLALEPTLNCSNNVTALSSLPPPNAFKHLSPTTQNSIQLVMRDSPEFSLCTL